MLHSDHLILSVQFWYRPARRFWRRGIALAVIVTFTLPYLTWAFEPGNYAVSQPNWTVVSHLGKRIELPEQLGTVSRGFQGGAKTIIHIQDLHCNYEVQTHIAGIIEYLAQHHSLQLVGEEGAFDAVHVSPLKNSPDSQARQEVGDYFVRQGKLSGAEFYALTGQCPIRLEGIETPTLYQRNLEQIRVFLNNESQGYCEDLRTSLNELKNKVYSSQLQRFDEKRMAYRAGDLTLLRYAAFLEDTAQAARLDLSVCTQLTRFLSLQQDFFGPEIDPDQLYRELDGVDAAVREGLYQTQAERRLDELIRRVDILERLINISATPEEVGEFRARREAFAVRTFLDFIHVQDAGTETAFDSDLYQLDRFLEAAAEFYRLADARSVRFVDNLLRKMDGRGENLAVMLTGGFHTPDILAELQRRNITCISITPRLSRQDIVNPYFELLQNKRTPLEKLLAKNQNIIALRTNCQDQAKLTAEQSVFAGLFNGFVNIVNQAEAWRQGSNRQPDADPLNTELRKASSDGMSSIRTVGDVRVIFSRKPDSILPTERARVFERVKLGKHQYYFITPENWRAVLQDLRRARRWAWKERTIEWFEGFWGKAQKPVSEFFKFIGKGGVASVLKGLWKKTYLPNAAVEDNDAVAPDGREKKQEEVSRGQLLLEEYDDLRKNILKIYARKNPETIKIIEKQQQTFIETTATLLMQDSFGITPEYALNKVLEGCTFSSRKDWQAYRDALREVLEFSRQAETADLAAQFVHDVATITVFITSSPDRELPLKDIENGEYWDFASGMNFDEFMKKLNPAVQYRVFDISPFVVTYLRKKAEVLGVKNVTVGKADITALQPPAQPLGVIRMKNVGTYVPGFSARILEMSNWLAEDGAFVFQNDAHPGQRFQVFDDLYEKIERLCERGWRFTYKFEKQIGELDTWILSRSPRMVPEPLALDDFARTIMCEMFGNWVAAWLAWNLKFWGGPVVEEFGIAFSMDTSGGLAGAWTQLKGMWEVFRLGRVPSALAGVFIFGMGFVWGATPWLWVPLAAAMMLCLRFYQAQFVERHGELTRAQRIARQIGTLVLNGTAAGVSVYGLFFLFGFLSGPGILLAAALAALAGPAAASIVHALWNRYMPPEYHLKLYTHKRAKFQKTTPPTNVEQSKKKSQPVRGPKEEEFFWSRRMYEMYASHTVKINDREFNVIDVLESRGPRFRFDKVASMLLFLDSDKTEDQQPLDALLKFYPLNPWGIGNDLYLAALKEILEYSRRAEGDNEPARFVTAAASRLAVVDMTSPGFARPISVAGKTRGEVLDLASGVGFAQCLGCLDKAMHYTAVDNSRFVIEYLKEVADRLQVSNVTFIQADIRDLDLQKLPRPDVIRMKNVDVYVPGFSAAKLAELAERLPDNGAFVFENDSIDVHQYSNLAELFEPVKALMKKGWRFKYQVQAGRGELDTWVLSRSPEVVETPMMLRNLVREIHDLYRPPSREALAKALGTKKAEWAMKYIADLYEEPDEDTRPEGPDVSRIFSKGTNKNIPKERKELSLKAANVYWENNPAAFNVITGGGYGFVEVVNSLLILDSLASNEDTALNKSANQYAGSDERAWNEYRKALKDVLEFSRQARNDNGPAALFVRDMAEIQALEYYEQGIADIELPLAHTRAGEYWDLASGINFAARLQSLDEKVTYRVFDTSPYVVAFLKKMAALMNVTHVVIEQADIRTLHRKPNEPKLGVIRMKNVPHYVEGIMQKLPEMSGWLSDEGALVIENDAEEFGRREEVIAQVIHELSEPVQELFKLGWRLDYQLGNDSTETDMLILSPSSNIVKRPRTLSDLRASSRQYYGGIMPWLRERVVKVLGGRISEGAYDLYLAWLLEGMLSLTVGGVMVAAGVGVMAALSGSGFVLPLLPAAKAAYIFAQPVFVSLHFVKDSQGRRAPPRNIKIAAAIALFNLVLLGLTATPAGFLAVLAASFVTHFAGNIILDYFDQSEAALNSELKISGKPGTLQRRMTWHLARMGDLIAPELAVGDIVFIPGRYDPANEDFIRVANGVVFCGEQPLLAEALEKHKISYLQIDSEQGKLVTERLKNFRRVVTLDTRSGTLRFAAAEDWKDFTDKSSRQKKKELLRKLRAHQVELKGTGSVTLGQLEQLIHLLELLPERYRRARLRLRFYGPLEVILKHTSSGGSVSCSVSATSSGFGTMP